jgi:uncharacterized membrane protein
MSYTIAYVAVLIVFGAIDAMWLSTMGPLLYRPALGDILASSLRIAPAIAFYLVYPIGVVVFAVLPALRAQTPLTAAALALLFGALAYATYDLTNYATLRNWTLQTTVLDIGYGTAAYFAVRAIAR